MGKGEGTDWSLLFGRNLHPVGDAVFSDWNPFLLLWASLGCTGAGRTLADVLLQDGTNVNHTLVKDGWCWWYQKYAPGNTVLEELEKAAREAKMGLWADPQPVPPWEWRKRNR